MLFVGGTWKTLGLWTRKGVGHLEYGLMGFPSKSIEDHALGDLSYRDPDQEISEAGTH